jgi:hypothetical protein
VILGFADRLHADPIVLTATRNVVAFTSIQPLSGDGAESLDLRTSDAVGPLELTAASTSILDDGRAVSAAAQRSDIGPTRFTAAASAESSAQGETVFSGAAAGSLFVVTFSLATPYRYQFTGNFARSGDGFVEFENGLIEELAGIDVALGSRGVLPAGEYRLFASVLAEANRGEGGSEFASGNFGVDLALQPVPEPGTLLLVGTALGAMNCRRRCRRHRGSQP